MTSAAWELKIFDGSKKMKSIPTIRMPFSMWHRPMLPVTLLLGLILLLVPVSEVTGHHHNRDDTASDASHHEQHRHRHHHRHHDNHENYHKRCPSHHHQDDENAIQAARSSPNLENVDEYSKIWSRHEPETQNRHDRLGTMAHRHSGHHLKVKPLSKEGEEISEEIDVDDPRWHEVREPWKKNQDKEVDRDELFAQQYSRKRQNKVAKVRSRHRQQVWRPNHQNDFEDNDRGDNEFQEDDFNEQENYARKLNQQDESSFQKSRVSSKLSDWLQRTRIKKPETTTARIDNELIRDGLEDEEQEDEDDVWLDVEQEDEGEMDNDFYENDEPVLDTRPPLKTYDDIIRRLTEGRVTSTSTQSPKKFHRGFQAHLKWDSHENLRHNSGESNSPRVLKFIDGSLATAESRTQPGKRHDSTVQKKKVEELEQNSESSGVANTDYVDDEQDESHRVNLVEEEELMETSSPTTTTTTTTTTTEPSTTTSSTTTSPKTTSTSTTSPTTTTTTTTTAKQQEQNFVQDTGANVVVGVSEKPVSIGHFSPGYEVKNEHSTVSKSHNTHKQQSHNTSGYGTKNNQGESGATTPSPKNSKSSERSKAVEYYHYVSTEGRCQWPKPKVIRVRDMHTNLAATYMPHCAILHRCSDDTGCCKTETETCEAKTTETVELYFMATYVGEHGKAVVERLSFQNHTECQCVTRGYSMQSDMGQMEWRATRQYTGARNVVRAPPKKWCRCPTQFTPKITEDGECECSCIEQDQDCSKLQSGKGYLSRVDRICIMTQQCSAPTCKFGEYVTSQGKCPKKKDAYLGQLPSNANLPQPSNLYYPQRRS